MQHISNFYVHLSMESAHVYSYAVLSSNYSCRGIYHPSYPLSSDISFYEVIYEWRVTVI